MTVEIIELALPDGPVLSHELTDAYLTKLGGRPTWPSSFATLESQGLCRESLKCRACGSALFLVLQMDCPWSGEEKYFDRIMYVFGCNSRVCTETHGDKAWTAFIVQTATKSAKNEAKTEAKPKVALWDAVMLGASSKTDDTMSTEMQSLSINEEPSKPIYDKQYPVGFPALRLRICEEMIREKSAKSSYSMDEEVPAAFSVAEGEEWGGEGYESSHPMGVDKAFLAFQKRVSSYPRQCVRFSPTSPPLLFHNLSSPLDSGCCAKCGQKRVFELQLMPAILSLLPTNDDRHLDHIQHKGQHPVFGDGMEWGTVMVFTCGTCTRTSQIIEATVITQIETI